MKNTPENRPEHASISRTQSGFFTATGQGQHACRNLSIERCRFFFARGAAAILTTALAFASCVHDLDGGKVAGDDMALVTLSLSTPAPPTRAAVPGSKNENQVDNVDVLLFTKDDDNLYYRASAVGTSIQPTPDATSEEEKKTFTVRLPINPLDGITPRPYKMVIISNARDLISYTPNSILSGPGRPAVLNALTRSVTAVTKLDYPFPMWGEYTSDLLITETSPPSSLAVDLTRAVARVDV